MLTTCFAVTCVFAAYSSAIAEPPAAELPLPAVISPGLAPLSAPSDAEFLFNGTSLEKWTKPDGSPSEWKLDGNPRPGAAVTCNPGTGNLVSTDAISDAQIHVEFTTPKADAEAGKKGQERGNSGVYIQGRYEVQVLDSYQNDTYADGQCGAIYKQHPPLVNACRAPGQWQTYDIVFTAPRFDKDGKKTANARLTVLHNGVLVQNNAEVTGPTGGGKEEAPTPGPLVLQDHGNLVQYRNVWVRRLDGK